MRTQPEWRTARLRSRRKHVTAIVGAIATAGTVSGARAWQLETDTPDLKMRWDNTLKYTAGWRVNNPNQEVATSFAQPNVDAGDLNFNKGLINNRIDLLSEFDLSYKRFGARISGAAWYDTVYNRDSTDFPASIPIPNTTSALLGGPNNRFTPSTEKLMGRHAEISDAFVYGSTDLGDTRLSARVGRHTQLYGETLFLGANGVAYAQGPVDLIKAFSLPGAQFKEIALPVGQVSSTLQVNPQLSFGAYYQFEWRPLRLPAAGSYFSPADFVGAGGDLLLVPVPGAANRTADRKGKDSGQFGFQAKFKPSGGDTEYSVFAAKYHEKAPVPVWTATDPGAFGAGTYSLFYQRDIKTFGASFSTLIGETNVAGEASIRRGAPLAPLGDLIVNFDPNADNSNNAPYALGNTLHANLSAISVYPATALWAGASLVAELAFNRLLAVTHNPTNPLFPNGVLNTTHTRDHWAMRAVFQPEYFQVLPQLDLRVPIGIGYGISGRSATFQLIPEHGGDVSVGMNFEYQKQWRAGLQFTHYFGPAGPAPSVGNPATATFASYKQYYRDRDYISFSLQRTF